MFIKINNVAPLCLKEPLIVPQKTLMGPGPSNCSNRVLNAMKKPILGHLHPECLKIMDDIKEGIKYIFQTKNPITMCISGSGHAGMEASLSNLLEENDIALFGATGIWGHRAAEMAKRYGANVTVIEAEPGKSLSVQQIKKALRECKPQLFFLAQGDSSTGVLQQNLCEIGLLCRAQNCILVVDIVASFGGTEFFMDEWNIDVAYTGSQKVLSGPPGLTPISFNERALKKIKSRKQTSKVYYWDILLVGQYWKCFGDVPRIYHHTVSSTLLYGLREALAILIETGLDVVIKRHIECAKILQKYTEERGLEYYVPNYLDRLPTVTTIKIPKGVEFKNISDYAMNRYSLEISGGLGPTLGKVFRVGIMGENATMDKIIFFTKVLNEAIENTSNFYLKQNSKL